MSRAATLIYNPNSGGADEISARELQDALHAAGFEPVYEATSSERDLDPILEDVEGLVVAAGGDGTLRAVATRLIGKDAALALIPLGTANNIAKALCIEGTPQRLIAGLENPRKRPFDVGFVQAPWGEDYFLEGMGCGVYADALTDYDPDEGKSFFRAVDAVFSLIKDYEPKRLQVKLDGKDLSCESVALEILNTAATGPRLRLAPDADPSDGLLDVVQICKHHRSNLLRYATNMLAESLERLPGVEVLRGERLEMVWTGFPLHIDAEVRPERGRRPPDRPPAKGARPSRGGGETQTVSVEVLKGAFTFWLPGEETLD